MPFSPSYGRELVLRVRLSVKVFPKATEISRKGEQRQPYLHHSLRCVYVRSVFAPPLGSHPRGVLPNRPTGPEKFTPTLVD